jgi:glycosyltransferase involved in cell wall biosynthesis
MKPRVSVVIATCRRPVLVLRAVRSALEQTVQDIEVIVVVDGPDPDTEAALATISDDRVRVHVRGTRGGQAAAINTGAELASSEWIALLDDDDHWFPEKLEKQLRVAAASGLREPVIACRYIARSEIEDVLQPRRIPDPGETIAEYLFCRRSLAFGEGAMQTSTLMIPAALLRRIPMDETLPVHCDLDWMVRVDCEDGVGFEVVRTADPLSVWEIQLGRTRLTHQSDWRFSFDWIGRRRESLTARAYAAFLLTWVSLYARRQRKYAAFFALTKEAVLRGRPNLIECMIHLSIWLLPDGFRERLSRSFASRPHPKEIYS